MIYRERKKERQNSFRKNERKRHTIKKDMKTLRRNILPKVLKQNE